MCCSINGSTSFTFLFAVRDGDAPSLPDAIAEMNVSAQMSVRVTVPDSKANPIPPDIASSIAHIRFQRICREWY